MVRADDPETALADLRRARRKARASDIDWVDALYRAYLTGLVGIVVVVVVSGWVGDGDVAAAGLQRVRDHGAAALGLGIALMVAMGLRSGSRGGPLAIEAADVRHVLLAPIDRRRALLGPVYRQLRHVLFVGVVVGAIAGQLAARRLPGNAVGWALAGAATASLAAAGAAGAGYVASGRRIRSSTASAVGLVLLAWAGGELAGGPPSPTGLLGRLALWPLHVDLLALAGVVLAIAVLVAGVLSVGGLAIEAAERRSSLIGRLAFAATLQDLRTVIVLRRQLAQEHPRRVPWSGAVPFARRFPIWARGWRGILRWPSMRATRLVALGAIAGASAVGVADGTTPLVVVSGLALYIAALDAVEALAQEIDHPSRLDTVPHARGAVLVRHIPAALVVMFGVCLVGLGTAFAIHPTRDTLLVGAVTVVAATAATVAGAAIGTVSGPAELVSAWSLAPPEVAGMRMATRLLWPPGLAILGITPVIAGVRGPGAGATSAARVTAAASLGVGVLVVAGGVIAWVYAREPVLEKMSASFDMSGGKR